MITPNPVQYDLALQLQVCQSNSRRNGKVARLPADLRDQINRMLDDGVPYKVIIQKLGPAGQHLTEHNLSNWRLGGFQDYRRSQLLSERARAQTEAAAILVRDQAHLDTATLRKACADVAMLQYLETVARHGQQLADESLKKNPAKFITLINACCNLNDAELARLKQQLKTADERGRLPAAAAT